eukprot:TRINITY_DN1487_c0_g1_i5.p2 TRINITY_DN1487_c0_g1~~TRINITY_DN1487_c0_g1_i5.p2  ORF type:complete len:256 (+),score=69.45 TRINITY_DN1487_c0_g1_i5:305-1072(+)
MGTTSTATQRALATARDKSDPVPDTPSSPENCTLNDEELTPLSDLEASSLPMHEPNAEQPQPGVQPDENWGAQLMAAALQPPVIASLTGFAIALTGGTSLDLREILVDTDNRDNDAPLEWLFNAMAKMGRAAVPINMLILGASLASFSFSSLKEAPWGTNLCVVLAKMVLMPLFGVLTAFGLRAVISFPPGMDASFLLVVMIVSCTPTANNIAVMAELGGQNNELLATCIFTQYLFAPLLLTASVASFVSICQGF